MNMFSNEHVQVNIDQSAFDQDLVKYLLTPTTLQPNVFTFLDQAVPSAISIINHELIERQAIKHFFVLIVAYEDIVNSDNEVVKVSDSYFLSPCTACLTSADTVEQVDTAFSHIFVSSQEHERRGSGWTVHSVRRLELTIVRYQPLHGGSTFVQLPPYITKKKLLLTYRTKMMIVASSGVYSLDFIMCESTPNGSAITYHLFTISILKGSNSQCASKTFNVSKCKMTSL